MWTVIDNYDWFTLWQLFEISMMKLLLIGDLGIFHDKQI